MRMRSEALSFAGDRGCARRSLIASVSSCLSLAGILAQRLYQLFLAVFQGGEQGLFQFLIQAGGRLDVPAAIERDLAQPSGPVGGPDRVAVHPLFLRAFDAEGLAGEVEVPLAGGPEERDGLEQVCVRTQGVPVADEVACGGDSEGGAAEHQERPVESTAVERHESLEPA